MARIVPIEMYPDEINALSVLLDSLPLAQVPACLLTFRELLRVDAANNPVEKIDGWADVINSSPNVSEDDFSKMVEEDS